MDYSVSFHLANFAQNNIMLQVEFDFRSKWFNLGWSVISLSLVFIIIKIDKKVANQPRLKSFWPEIKLTCNIYTKEIGVCKHIHNNIWQKSRWFSNHVAAWRIKVISAQWLLELDPIWATTDSSSTQPGFYFITPTPTLETNKIF